MKKDSHFAIVALIILSSVLHRCAGEEENPIIDPKIPAAVVMESPTHDQQFVAGDDIAVKFQVNDAAKVNNLKILLDNQIIAENIESKGQTISVSTSESRVGFVNLQLTYTDENGKPHQDTRRVILFSDIVPSAKTVVIINKYPHLNTSYTQGLEFYNGNLYESTGQYGTSFIAEVDLKTGVHKRNLSLDSKYFGEGITILNDTIYQITYQSGICKVYDLAFNYIKEYNYSGEGWGLCNNGESLIMTNGSSEVVWRNSQTFEITKKLDIFSNDTDLNQLNELELINGNLYANIYMDNRIVEIDTTNGKVISFIDCSALVSDGQVVGADVLNGIAHNPETAKTYLTGKLWPTLYEVTFK